jgi:hypothetical protein
MMLIDVLCYVYRFRPGRLSKPLVPTFVTIAICVGRSIQPDMALSA